MIKVYPWNVPPGNAREPKPRSDGLQLARYDQSLLDSGKFENRAALARFLGVSRAGVTQVLYRPKSTENGEVSGVDQGVSSTWAAMLDSQCVILGKNRGQCLKDYLTGRNIPILLSV